MIAEGPWELLVLMLLYGYCVSGWSCARSVGRSREQFIPAGNRPTVPKQLLQCLYVTGYLGVAIAGVAS